MAKNCKACLFETGIDIHPRRAAQGGRTEWKGICKPAGDQVVVIRLGKYETEDGQEITDCGGFKKKISTATADPAAGD